MELRGLQGYRGMPKEDQDAFDARYDAYDWSPEKKDIAFNNIRFRDTFGQGMFNSMSYEDRNAYYADWYINKTFQDTYGDLPEFHYGNDGRGTIYSTEAKRYLLENDYLTKDALLAKKDNIRKDYSTSMIYSDPGAWSSEAYISQAQEAAEKLNNKILEKAKLIDKQTLQNKESIKLTLLELAQTIKNNLEQNPEYYDNINSTFDGLLSNSSNIYKAYKEEPEFLPTLNDKINVLSSFYAMAAEAEKTDNLEEKNAIMENAYSILNDYVLHEVFKNTSELTNIGHTVKAVGTKGFSNIMQTRTGLKALYLKATNENAYSNYILGLDENGNPLPWADNMQTLSKMDFYNTFSPSEVANIDANGGVSKYTIPVDVGHEYDLIGKKSLYDAGAMTGYILGSLALDYATLGVGKVLSTGTKATTKALLKSGIMSLETVNNLRKVVDNPVVDITTDLLRLQIHSTSEATLEGASVASELYNLILDNHTNVEDYLMSDDIKLKMWRELLERLAQEFPDGRESAYTKFNPESPVSMVNLYDVREDELKKEILDKYTKEFELKLEIAAEAASKAYLTQYSAMMIKNTLTDGVFNGYMFAKPFATRTRLGNFIDPKKTTVKNGAFEAKNFTYKDAIRVGARTSVGGFIEETSDNEVHLGAYELGLNYYNNWLRTQYNGDNIATADLMANAFTAYITGLDKAFHDRQTYLEGIIGAISPSVIMPSTHIFGLASKENRDYYKSLLTIEKINYLLYNPIMQEVVLEREEFQKNADNVDIVNKILQDNAESFKDVAAGLGVIRDFYDIRHEGTIVDAKDAKFNVAFKFLTDLAKLESSKKVSSRYDDYLNTLNKAASGEITNEMISSYLRLPENQDLVSLLGREKASLEAAQQIQKNAELLLSLYKLYQDTRGTLLSFANDKIDSELLDQLIYLLMVSKEWSNRVRNMEKELTGNSEVSTSSNIGQMTEAGVNTLTELISTEIDISPKSIRKDIRKKIKKRLNLFKNATTSEVLTAEEIIHLNPEERARMINNHHFYTLALIEEIEKAENILAQADPDYRLKVEDIALLQKRIDLNNTSFKYLLDNPKKLYAYRAQLSVQALHDSLLNIQNAQFEALLSKLDNAYNLLDYGVTFLDESKKLNVESLLKLLEYRPLYSDIIEPLLDRAKTISTLSNVIDNLDVDALTKKLLKINLGTVVQNANFQDELINDILNFIENSELEFTVREQLNQILDSAKDVVDLIDATKVEENDLRLKKELLEKEKKRKEEEKITKQQEKEQKETERKEDIEKKETQEEKPDNVQIVSEEPLDLWDNPDEVLLVKSSDFEESPLSNEQVEITTATSDDSELPPESDNTEPTQLRGNTITTYEINTKESENLLNGFLRSRIDKVTGWLKDLFLWFRSTNVEFLDVIDYELSDIAALNPDVKFLLASNQEGATNDRVLLRNPLLVVEYTDAIRKIHNEERSKPIRVNGKDWLVIGSLGYFGDNEKLLYLLMVTKLTQRRDVYFKQNPAERFYIDDKFHTTIKSIASGRIINVGLNDSEITDRNLQQLMYNEDGSINTERNPHGLTWKDLSFVVTTRMGEFIGTKPVNGEIESLYLVQKNAGNVFLLVKAANGKYTPLYINPTFLSEIKDGDIKTQINGLFMLLLSINHSDRLLAVSNLCQILVFDDENNILIGTKDRNTISIVENGVTTKSWNLDDPSLNRLDVLTELNNTRFRIQLSKNNLKDIKRLLQLDEAGALSLNVALLGTAGSHFTIQAMNLETGEPIELTSDLSQSNFTESTYNSAKVAMTLYNGRRFSKVGDSWFNEHGQLITNITDIQKLNIIRSIQESLIPSVYKDNLGYNVYILNDSNDSPLVVRINLSNKIDILDALDAQTVIRNVQRLKDKDTQLVIKMEDIELDWEDIPALVPTEEIISTEDLDLDWGDNNQPLREHKEKNNKSTKLIEITPKKSLKDLENSENLRNFAELVRHPDTRDNLLDNLETIYSDKGWGELPDSFDDILKSLESHNVNCSSITNIDDWLNLIKNCK